MSSYFRPLKLHPRSTALNYLSALMQFYFNEFARIYRFPRMVGVGNAVWGVAHISCHLESGALAISIQSKASLRFPYGWQSRPWSADKVRPCWFWSLKFALTNVAICRGRKWLVDAYYWHADAWCEDVSRCGCRNLKLLLHRPSSR